MKQHKQCTLNDFRSKFATVNCNDEIFVGPESYVDEFVLYLYNLYNGPLCELDLSYLKSQQDNFCKLKVQGAL